MYFIIRKIIYKKLSKEFNYQGRIRNKLRRGLIKDKVKYVVKRSKRISLDKMKCLEMYRKSKI